MLGGVNEGMEVFAGRAGLGKAVLLLGMRWVARGLNRQGHTAMHTQSPASDCTHWRGVEEQV